MKSGQRKEVENLEITVLKKTNLFIGMSEEEIRLCLTELRAAEKKYRSGERILLSGSRTERMGLVLSGSVTIEQNDTWGNCTILSHVGPGQIFAETYALLPDEIMLVDVRANEDCRILFIRVGGLLTGRSSPAWKDRLIRNLLLISAHKNLTLSGRSFHTAPKSARGRILSYLSAVSIQKQSSEFEIPFNRQQLADYLNLERTSLSKELGRMQRDGMIEYRKNHFRLL